MGIVAQSNISNQVVNGNRHAALNYYGCTAKFKSGVFYKAIFFIAVLLMLFAQIEGTFDDIPQAINAITKILFSVDPHFVTSSAVPDIRLSASGVLTETDEDDEEIPIHVSFIVMIVVASIRKARTAGTHKARLIESGASKDKSPPSMVDLRLKRFNSAGKCLIGNIGKPLSRMYAGVAFIF